MVKRTIITLLLCACIHTTAFCQSEDFMKVYRACLKAQSSMKDIDGSKPEIREALKLITDAKWSMLIMQNEDVRGEANIKKHMIFTTSFFNEMSKGNNVFKKAKEYAKEQAADARGGNVYLGTKCVGAGKKVTYKMNHMAKTLRVGAVAEVNGLINLSVIVKDARVHVSKPYKVTSDEYHGAPSRLLDEIKMPSGKCVVYITIENKYREPKSVAIIVE